MNKFAESGICPNCGSMNLSYGTAEIDSYSLYYPCECVECGTKFKECYELEFNGNADINNKKETIDFLSV